MKRPLKDRLKEAMDIRRVNQARLAKAVGVKPASVNDWLSGKTKSLKGENLHKLCKFLRIRQEWLLDERGTMDAEPANISSTDETIEVARDFRGGAVPRISWVQAGQWCDIEDQFNPSDAEDWNLCPRPHGPHTFALRVRGVSMEPKYQDGDIIFVDPDVRADHGRNVIAKLREESEATFKQLVIEGERQFLRPLNQDWPGPKLIPLDENTVICGVVIGKWVES